MRVNYTTPVSLIAPTVTVSPSSSTITTEQSLPVTTDMGAQTLPVTLTLQPWSMNVVLIK